MPIFKFEDEEALGKVASVDTTNVIVEVENVDQLKRLQVNHLAVLQSSRPGQHLIGLITQVTRKRGIEDIINDGVNDHAPELNLCRIALHRPGNGDTLVVLSVIDNLVKGASGQAIQNLNLMFGLDEMMGIGAPAMMP